MARLNDAHSGIGDFLFYRIRFIGNQLFADSSGGSGRQHHVDGDADRICCFTKGRCRFSKAHPRFGFTDAQSLFYDTDPLAYWCNFVISGYFYLYDRV